MTNQTKLTGQAAADAGRTALEAAGIDLVGLERRRNYALGASLPVLTTARDAVENIGRPGAGTRFHALQDAIATMTAADPTMAVIVAAARWTDRYGSSGAPARLSDLTDTIEHLHDGYAEPPEAPAVDRHGWAGPGTLEDAIESGAYTGQRQSVHDVLGPDYLD